MSVVERSWLDSHLASDPGVQAAERAAAALGSDAHLLLLAAGDRIAASSPAAALAYYRHAAQFYAELGAAGHDRWLSLGGALASPGAIGYFALPLRAFGANPLATAEAWCELGREVTRQAGYLGRLFFERTASVLVQTDGLARLRAWVSVGLHLAGREARAGGSLAEPFFESAPSSIGAIADPARWALAALALGKAIDGRAFFSTPPAALPQLSAAEQASLLASIARVAGEGETTAARTLYAELPRALAQLAASPRAALLELLQRMSGVAVRALADLAPSLPGVLAGVPHRELDAALHHVGAVAERHPEASIAALRVLPDLYQRASAKHVGGWFSAGLEVAADSGEIAKAFFALESRTSVDWLRTASHGVGLDDDLGVWRKFIQMLCADACIIRRVDTPSLRPPLEDNPEAYAGALPERIEWLPSYAQNRAVYRFLALQLAGRREFGTYDFGDALGHDVATHLRGQPPVLEALFRLAEAVRVQHRIDRMYPGSMQETRTLASALLARWHADSQPDLEGACDALLALALGDRPLAPVWLPPSAAERILVLLAPLRRETATVEHALAAAWRLLALFASPGMAGASHALAAQAAEAGAEVQGGEPFDLASEAAPQSSEAELPAGSDRALPAQASDSDAAARPARGGRGKLGDGVGDGSLPLTASGEPLETGPAVGRRVQRRAVYPGTAQIFLYDEWDHTIGDYRSRHCRVHEIPGARDTGAFFERTVKSHAGMLSEVRRQFERMRPERYRPLRGLEDGEDFDLNALTEARIEARARRTPSTRIYTARTRQTRDVATLFLLDMSGSTEQPYAEPGEAPRARRIIDTLKEALVILSTALDDLGDSYAIYGFSSQGRNQVEVYPVKTFGESLGPNVKARIGGIEPKSGTRMGAALRHVMTKFARVHTASKHLILLSDGFPQDHEYGPDRRSHTYGIQDTAVALREVNRAGTTPFCITVDRAGNDYLRLMCDASQYLVIADVEELPRELPKIYRKVVQT